MNTLRALATSSFALAAAGAAFSIARSAPAAHGEAAYPGGVGRIDRGRGPAGPSSFRDDSRSRFMGEVGGWGFAHAREGGRHEHRRSRWGYASRYPYGSGYAYGDEGLEGAYAGGYQPAGFGPQEPYGGGGYATMARPTASALAPLAYGPGVHDGAYAYGYNGYAQTPPLPPGNGPVGWAAFPGGRGPCGC